MGFKAITVNTAEDASPHIGAEDDAALYSGIIGTGGILNIGSCMVATVESGTSISLSDGVVVNNGGRYGHIPKGESETFEIEPGIEGQKRVDLIVCRYTNEGSSDNLSLVLIPGTAGSSASAPDTESGDLILYQIDVIGYEVTVERVAPLINGLYLTAQQITKVVEQIESLESSFETYKGNTNSLERGTTVVNIPSGATSVKFLTGITGNPVIIVTNGAGTANKTHICGTTIQDGDVYAIFDPDTVVVGGIRINYVIIR